MLIVTWDKSRDLQLIVGYREGGFVRDIVERNITLFTWRRLIRWAVFTNIVWDKFLEYDLEKLLQRGYICLDISMERLVIELDILDKEEREWS